MLFLIQANAYGIFNFKKEMRAVPSLDQTSGVSWYQYVNVGQGDNFDSFTLALGTTRNCRLLMLMLLQLVLVNLVGLLIIMLVLLWQ
jgi:hypothetical protein